VKPHSVAVSCEGYVGLPGSGKTYALAARGLNALRSGRRVFSNFGLQGSLPIDAWDHNNMGKPEKGKNPDNPCTCGSCFVSISKAVILLDEINLWAPSRLWNELPLGLMHRWAQIRKYETMILWSAQHEARVDKVVRELTGFIWECQTNWNRRKFILRAYEPNDFRKQSAKALETKKLKLRRSIASAYDTLEIVGTGTHLAGSETLTSPSVGTVLPLVREKREPIAFDGSLLPADPFEKVVELDAPEESEDRHSTGGW